MRGIDYKLLGQGWDHPTARILYRTAQGDSFRRSMSIEGGQAAPKPEPPHVMGYYSRDGHHTQPVKISSEAKGSIRLGCGRPNKDACADVQ